MDSVKCCLLISATLGKLFLQEFRMRKSFFLLLAVIGFFLFVVGFRLFSDGAIVPSAIAFIAGGGMAYWAYRRYRQREHEHITCRIASLTKEPWSSHQVLRIKASVVFYPACIIFIGLFIILPIIALSSVLTDFPPTQWGVLGVSFILFSMLCMGILFLVQLIPSIGKPLVELTAKGIKTPWYGMISWSDIEGIHLHSVYTRGGKLYTLILKTNECLKKDHFHWTRKGIFLAFSRPRFSQQEINVQLTYSRESPKVIEAVARFLWTQATGLSHDWSPMRSEEINQLNRKIREAEAKRELPDFSFIAGSETMSEEELAQEIRASYKSGDPGALKLARMANEQLQRSEQIMRDREKLERLFKREFKKTMWKLCVTVFFAVALTFIYFKYLMR